MADPTIPAPPRRPALIPFVPATTRLAHAAPIRALQVPDPAPAYDDAASSPGSGPAWPSRPAGSRRAAKAARSAARPGHAPPLADLRWPSLFAQVLAETLTGSRPLAQIRPWTTDQARRRIRELAPVLAASYQPRIRRVIVTSPAADVIEMAMVVGLGTRVRAVAVRLERPARPTGQAAPWRCTAVEATGGYG